MLSSAPGQMLSTILKHDAKVTSYKMALLRAINDVVLAFPDRGGAGEKRDIAVPLRFLAELWVAYYWPFVQPDQPIWQGPLSKRATGVTNDMAFRPPLSRLRWEWEQIVGGAGRPSDGFFLINELRVPRKRAGYPAAFLHTYAQTLRAIQTTLQMPIRYAGPGQWSVFARPWALEQLGTSVVPLPGTHLEDVCLVIEAALWQSFAELSLWIEALCIHEWCLFAAGRTQTHNSDVDSGSDTLSRDASGSDLRVGRGLIYELLTDRPGNRRPLTWERNHIDILLLEGRPFRCPWTQKPILPQAYALDHIVPVSVYPINELWNLVPTDPAFNSHVKSNRLPSAQRLASARPLLAQAYGHYQTSKPLSQAMHEDVALRFALETQTVNVLREELAKESFATQVAGAVTTFAEHIATTRNLARF